MSGRKDSVLLLAAVVHFHFKAECKSSSAAARLKLEPILILEGDYLPTSVRPYVCMYVQYVRMYNLYVCMYVCTISNRCTICTYVQYVRMYVCTISNR